ncbi:Methyltransferase domain-containing protein [Haladaptatus litoreus]|uniref:Methyltransferase domain-containing protein n=1 Tax=Haladaptatus litoreus TaxID=553468 RepID=A0A1N7FA50_9EURY|nr:class I SAM-dependent methyltransferase [Haladaptatus litoreus]SIR97142.1 Methyltransferase domain-containing protein [Haladaptatus litoreus]
MPTESTVYRVLLAMPSEITAERQVAKDVVLNWNASIGRQQNIYLGPVDANHVDVSRSDLADEIDIVLGAFWTTVDAGTASGESLADAVQRLAIEEDLPAVIGFSERDIPPNRLDPEQYERLQEFRDDCRSTGYFTYVDQEEYEEQLTNALARTMDQLLSSSDCVSNTAEEHEGPSEYDPEVDHDRLQLSAAMHEEQDNRNIDQIVGHLQEKGIEQPYSVLDAGCGYGTVTQSRFGDDDRFEVVAIDDAEEVLKVAKDRYSASNIEYRWLNVNNLNKANLGTFDIVFSSYLFHHVANQESILSLLWEQVRDNGAMAIRSCDDGQHLHYPPDEEMDWIVETTDAIPGSSDRTHGRRLPTHLKRLSPPPMDVWLDLQNYHTVGRESAERRDYWSVFHSNRLHYAKVRAERADATQEDKQLYETMANRMERLENKIVGNEHVFDVKSVPFAVAVK